jgi:hypothetical protein
MADDTPQDSTTPPADQPPTDGATPPADDNLGDPGKRALEAERAARREAEKQAKAVQKELEQLRQAQLSDSEKALAEAEARGKAAATTTFGQRLAAARFVAEAARRNADFDASGVLDDLNLAKYVGEDGEPDDKGIAAVVERLVPERQQQTGPKFGNADLGPRSTPAPPTDGSPKSLIAAGIAAADAAKR